MPINYFTFPNEITVNSSELKYKLGQLTDNGIKMEYLLGKKLASKYNFLISQNFSTEENIYATSGIDKRVVESLLAVLGGMFPLSNNDTLYNIINWKPIAIETNEIYDECGTGIWNSCSYFKDQLIQTSDYKKIDSYFAEDKKTFSQLTSINIETLKDLDNVVDNLQTRYNLNNLLPIPAWAMDDKIKRRVIEVHNGIQASLSQLFANDIGGWHHQTIIKGINNFITNKTASKIHLYGVHDTNIMLLSQIYGISNLSTTLVPYSSYLIFEIHFINSTYYVKAQYGNGSDPLSVDSPISFSNCGEYCLLSDFISLVPITTTEDWNFQCKGPTKFSENCKMQSNISTSLNFILISALMLTIVILLRYRTLNKNLILNEETPLIIKDT
uniref:2-phosphoxylose phosphatase 1 n=1 Tax=Strongyloides papillosus TaxID=174720 RepID=A0A0N5BNX4_STREA